MSLTIVIILIKHKIMRNTHYAIYEYEYNLGKC